MTRIVATSDTHFQFDTSLIPDGDIFVHAGDLMLTGKEREWKDIVDSLVALPHKHKIIVPGNHDFFIEKNPKEIKKQLAKENIIVLDEVNPVCLINDIVFGGIPFVTNLRGWAYNRTEEQIMEHFHYNPALYEADILITHAPPHGIRDKVESGLNVGTLTYSNRIFSGGLRPIHWIFGHIHEDYGVTIIEQTTFHNVAMCNRDYDQVNKAHVIDLET